MSVNVIWFKRDLRLSDHEPLGAAIDACNSESRPLLLLYVFEDFLIDDPHYSERHWRFVYQSLVDMAQRLPKRSLWVRRGEALDVLEAIHKEHEIHNLYSHQEIGLGNTFDRDKNIANWCQEKSIVWHEFQTGAVHRALPNRDNWDREWNKTMRSEIEPVDFTQVKFITTNVSALDQLDHTWKTLDDHFQKGGEQAANDTLEDFLNERGKAYAYSLSSPSLSREHCSRLSPYLAWGNISLRQVYQTVLSNWQRPGWRRTLSAFSSRLHWHCHFIQKFESESRLEFEPINRGYLDLPRSDDNQAKRNLEAWKRGHTGYPMIDACMRCLIATGYINFRMRAMLVSFLTHHLALDWRQGVHHLAQVFLDFEPGIHYTQFQMQAGVTGINMIRMYNPTKQAQEKDPEAVFIKQWLPELAAVPVPLVFEPWTMTEMDQMMHGVKIGDDYPEPIIDLKQAAKQARDLLWSWRKKPLVIQEAKRIIKRHVRSN
ncbi:MAG: deoxyribodipyrimidine photo-lyase [Kangiellaceae bacterium]|jgi:deoxyribodipyrimidine photo-lyase|nr:deoxyribodipyrimidine photo-lyase [Kangiellaceae bacterium]